jgi:hypothetical protein
MPALEPTPVANPRIRALPLGAKTGCSGRLPIEYAHGGKADVIDATLDGKPLFMPQIRQAQALVRQAEMIGL